MTCSASSAKGWWRNPWMLSSSVLGTQKSSSPLATGTSLRGLHQRIKKVEISEPDRCLPSSFALVYFGHCRMWLFNYLPKYVRRLLSTFIVLIFISLAKRRRRCYIGPSDLTSRSVLSDFLFSLLNLSRVRHSHNIKQGLGRHNGDAGRDVVCV